MYRCSSAHWPTSLWVISALGAAALAAATFVLLHVVPFGTRVAFAATLGTALAFVPPITALISFLFVVTAYEVTPTELRVQGLLWATVLPLSGVHHIWHDPTVTRLSLRLFGNGGLYSFTGLFQNSKLGRYRAFLTDPKRAVVIQTSTRTIVISPADPQAFVESVSVMSSASTVPNCRPA